MNNISDRLSKLEGQIGVQQWAVGLVSAVMIGAIAILVTLVMQLSTKVDNLPVEINTNLQQLVTTLSTAITAKNSDQPPTVIIVPTSTGPQSPTLDKDK